MVLFSLFSYKKNVYICVLSRMTPMYTCTLFSVLTFEVHTFNKNSMVCANTSQSMIVDKQIDNSLGILVNTF